MIRRSTSTILWFLWNRRCGLVVALLSLLFSWTNFADDLAGADLIAARSKDQEGLKVYGKNLSQKLAFYEFEPTDDLTKLTIDEAWVLQLVNLHKAAAWNTNQSPTGYLEFSGSLIFPISVATHPRAVLFINRRDDKSWAVGAFGMPPLARKLHALRQHWPKQNLVLVTIPGTPAFYYHVPQLEFCNLTSLQSIPTPDKNGIVGTPWTIPVKTEETLRSIFSQHDSQR
jgi:hypothetical protein